MELIIGFYATGIVVLSLTLWRIRKYLAYCKLIEELGDTYVYGNFDNSNTTNYTDCVSHSWIINNVVLKKHGKLGQRFQDHMFHDTYATMIWFSLTLGISILILGVVLVRSIQVAGTFLIIFLIGAFAILGSGDAKDSEDLLAMLQTHKIKDLQLHDYTYAIIALGSIKKRNILSAIIGTILVISAPYGEVILTLASWTIATLTAYLILNPTLFLSEFSMPIAILYLTAAWPLLVFIIIYVAQKAKGSRGETHYTLSRPNSTSLEEHA